MTIKRAALTLLLLVTSYSHAASFVVTDPTGEPVGPAMITASPLTVPESDLSDNGYAPHGVTNRAAVTLTRFTDSAGRASFATSLENHSIRVRAQGFVDATVTVAAEDAETAVTLQPMSREQLIASFPSNVWLSQLNFGGDAELKKTFQLNCAFCHQQASPFMRNERTVAQWLSVFERMNGYGARLPNEDHQRIAELLQTELRELRENPQQVPEPREWEPYLADYRMTEWPIGDGFSQMHDFLLHPNGMVYVGDNLFDRIYEVNPATGDYTVYKVPHREGDSVGGILGNRFTVFPKMDNTMGVHSFAYSRRDGNIFITPSMQQALLEFNPETKAFTIHEMDAGFYPHTIRTDDQDRVWFTLALSSQVARFDRDSGEFTLYDLPARNIREWLVLKSLPLIFWMDPERRPQPAPDREGTGLPMPYGIDVAPDGRVWVARLYANDLAVIDPATDEVTMIDFPFAGPRRLRADAEGNLWIVAFQDSLLVKYDPATAIFTDYPLPVINEIPYALNVDRERGVVWVNGNQSDTVMSFDIASEAWRVFPMPRQRFFTRDIEVAEDSGAVYTSNSHFPTWQTEGGVPTLLRITPLAE
ncbi:lyase [Haliea sp. E1-2-M8]|uniref:lyase n=1 Tax=Haliea sp. E1-2-M8 TaxID=3064706 RepID=UPI00272677FC|nr:lyase [Haliea sp. E1-2-M8]MDO8863318.1 lyase [Haliea sp. E1-2-M8]